MTDTPELRLHNTLSGTKELFVPLDPADIRVYACGPTVYDRIHIGNARPIVVFDVFGAVAATSLPPRYLCA